VIAQVTLITAVMIDGCITMVVNSFIGCKTDINRLINQHFIRKKYGLLL